MIHVEGIGKRYRLGATIRHDTLRDLIAHRAKSLFTGRRAEGRPEADADIDHFWALRDVSFSVAEGEVMGIIGKNGAGKSTLLKILSRITPPTEGRITLNGRVASLLEVGTGFHPELSGRENVYMNGAVLGMTRREIRAKFDEIVAFSGVEKFLDTPVKRYSSGMYVRLAFAVAAHLDPEILIVDEVLAVGDAEFQKKCLGKMGEVAKGGRTVLFVSHNMGAIQQLTNRCLVIVDGRNALDADPMTAVSHYLHASGGQQSVSERMETSADGFFVDSLAFEPGEGVGGFNQPLSFRVELSVPHRLAELTIGLQIVNSFGARIATAKADIPDLDSGRRVVTLVLPTPYLPPGRYLVNVGMDIERRGVFFRDSLLAIEVSDAGVRDAFMADRRDRLGVYLPVQFVVK